MQPSPPQARPGFSAAIATADEATLVKLLTTQGRRPRQGASPKPKVPEKAFEIDQAGLLRIWRVCTDLGIPRERSVPWLLSLVGSSVSEIARESGSHRTSINAVLRGSYSPPLGVWRALKRVLGFDPFSKAK